MPVVGLATVPGGLVEIVVLVLVIVLTLGAPVLMVLWFLRQGPDELPAQVRERAVARSRERHIAREIRVQCADLDREYARLVRRGGRL